MRVQFVYVQLLQRRVLLDLTAVTWYKTRLTQAVFVACFLAFALFVGTWFDTNGPTRGSTAAAFAACSSLAMVVLKQKNYLQQERYLVPLNFIMQASSTDGDSLYPGATSRNVIAADIKLLQRGHVVAISYTFTSAGCKLLIATALFYSNLPCD